MKTTNEIAQEATSQYWIEYEASRFKDSLLQDKLVEIITKAIEAAQAQGEPVKSTRPLTAQEAQELKAIGITGECRRVIAFNDRPAPPKRQPLTPDDKAKFNAAINFACQQDEEAGAFLRAWREGDTSEWPEFEAAINGGGA